MAVREKKFKCKDYLEVEIYAISKKEHDKSRSKKKKESRKEQKNLNDKNAKKKIRRVINNNFDKNDYVAHGTFEADKRPKDEDDLKRCIRNYIRKINRLRKKLGLENMKYLYVMEYAENTKLHFHIVMEGSDVNIDGKSYRDVIEDMWSYGWMNIDRLKPNEFGFKDLASYLTKNPKGKKRWIPSRNLVYPEASINDNKISHRKLWYMFNGDYGRKEIEDIYEGYTLTEIETGDNEITGRYVNLFLRKRE